ncbi:MAG: hypothetical protein HKM98_07085 [Gammaproteobacteria bacterium]|nr:hypothetical protein [Gammaproteobacteria bacterium]
MHRITGLVLAASLGVLTAVASDIEKLPDSLQEFTMQLVGYGDFKRWGFHIYDVSYWQNGGDTRALKIIYRKNISSDRLIKSTLSEWGKVGTAAVDQQLLWADQLSKIWPDVSPGDSLIAVVAETHTEFTDGAGKTLGRVDDATFGQQFLDIWLHPDSSAGRLRDELLGQR